jgi:myo-inositol 2-dehydrogenase / D-chiro-inositol 1-dehydrogenase
MKATSPDWDRRAFLSTSSRAIAAAGLAAAATLHSGPARRASAHPTPTTPATQLAEKPASPNARPGVGVIGVRYQGTVITDKARDYGDIVAICDVDRNVREQARASFGSAAAIMEDYQDLLARKDVDVVLIGTPDHWHAKMLIDACRAGKDVYCEKPLSLTVAEGQTICQAVRETGRIVQVGSWQRSDARFRLAVELVRGGRIGKLQQVDVVLGKNVVGGPFIPGPAPRSLNWNLWQGQTPDTPYIEERCHYTFRWWLEYSGGQMTDWGAHHLDIAQWAIDSEPVRFSGSAVFPDTPRGYNVPRDFESVIEFANGVRLTVSDTGRNGILFTGEHGRIFVNRGSLEGRAVEELGQLPLQREDFRLYADNLTRPPRAGKLDAIVNHMGNFFDCVTDRQQPLSDVITSHRTASLCHLANIALRVGRPLRWDAATQQCPDDPQANGMLAREQRAGFEVA